MDLLASVAVAGQKYAIRSDDRCSLVGPDNLECVDNIKFSMIGAELSAAVRPFSSLWVKPYVGMTLYRRFEMFTDKKEAVGPQDDNLANGPYFGLRLEFRLPD